jgi:hypothetical protein
MKKLLILCALLLLFSCKKDGNCSGTKDASHSGVITSADMRMCACCGGYFIQIEGVTWRFFQESLPPNNLQLTTENLPMKVRLDWAPTAQGCMNDLITITKIEKE